jgi:hypothetical protein
LGLDVYLHRCPNRAYTKSLEDRCKTETNAIWQNEGKSYDEMTKEERIVLTERCASVATALGLDQYGTHPDNQPVEIDSVINPSHMFKIGYFRSSYNEGGINSILRRFGVPDLYEIFQPGDEYEFAPHWEACLERCKKAIAHLQVTMDSDEGQLDVYRFSVIPLATRDPLPTNELEAKDIFVRELKENPSPFRSYFNYHGNFMLDGHKVFALIRGTNSFLGETQPCVYVVREGEGLQWYLDALKIVKETIEYVLAQPDPENYYLHWSA